MGRIGSCITKVSKLKPKHLFPANRGLFFLAGQPITSEKVPLLEAGTLITCDVGPAICWRHFQNLEKLAFKLALGGGAFSDKEALPGGSFYLNFMKIVQSSDERELKLRLTSVI